MCRYEMLYGIEKLTLLTVSSFLMPLVFMAVVYISLFITTKRQVLYV